MGIVFSYNLLFWCDSDLKTITMNHMGKTTENICEIYRKKNQIARADEKLIREI